MDTISDYREHAFLKNYINEKHLNSHPKLRNIYLCGTGLIKNTGHEPGVFLFKNDNPNDEKHPKAKFFGATTCRSAWSCPTCSAKVMAKYGAKIACLIDALAKWQNRYAVMITFTLPHSKNMTCQQTFDILTKSWTRLTKAGKQKNKNYKYVLKNDEGQRSKKGGKLGVGKKGTVKIYKKGFDIFGDFRETLNINHVVKVYEFTWGENGWHPHLHILFWMPKQNLSKVLSYEKKINDRWWQITKKTAQEVVPNLTEQLYPEWKKDYHPGVHISRDKKDPSKPHIQKSSYYITGWTGDMEATSQNKKAREGHYTPFQLIQKARETNDDKYLNLFLEYAITTHHRARITFSKNGGNDCSQIIKRWIQTNDYIEAYTKKNTKTKWTMAYWFTEKSWLEICYLESISGIPIRAEILKYAHDIDQLEFYLTQLNPKFIIYRKHPHEKFIEDLMNSA